MIQKTKMPRLLLIKLANEIKKNLSVDEMAKICAVASHCDKVQNMAFAVLLEKYHIRGRLFSDELAKQRAAFEEIYRQEVTSLHKSYSASSQAAIAAAFEVVSPENINEVIEEKIETSMEPLIKEAHLQGQKDGGKARAKVGGHLSHKEDYECETRLGVWFAENYSRYPRAMKDCAVAATKIEPIKSSTAMTYLKRWKKKQKTEMGSLLAD